MISARQRNIALLVASCFFMQNLDGTIVTTSSPAIGKSLHVSALQVSLVITAYLITFAVLIPLGSWMIARVGTRRLFLVAICFFTISSLFCAISVNLGMLVLMRILQGAGAAMMTPTGRLVALTKIEKHDILRVMSFIVWPSLIAPVLAPYVGGLITTYASWRWIFLINLPLGAIAFLIGLRLMPVTQRPAPQRLDGVGLGLTAVGLGGVTYAAHLLSVSTPAVESVLFWVVSLVVLGLAIRHLRRASRPLLELDVFAIRSFRSSNSGMTVFTLVVGSVPFLLPLLFESVFGWSSVKAGAYVICVFIGNLIIKPATTQLLRTFGFRTMLAVSSLGVAISLVLTCCFVRSTPDIVIIAVLIFGGSARSMGYTSYMSLGFSDIPEPQMRDANVLASTVQQCGAAFAIAGAAIALHVGTALSSFLFRHPTPRDGYVTAFALLALLSLVTLGMALHLPLDAGEAVRGRQPVEEDVDGERLDLAH